MVAIHWDGLGMTERGRRDVGPFNVEFLGHIADLGLLLLLRNRPDGSGWPWVPGDSWGCFTGQRGPAEDS